MLSKHWLHSSLITRLQLSLICLAVALIFWKLGGVPRGMTVDEAAIGYNGYAVVTTRRDEWLHKLPVSFQSFGDYKSPLAIYINGLFTYTLGMNLWVVRLPFAIAGVLTVVGLMKLIELFYRTHHPLSSWTGWTPEMAGVTVGGLLVTTPWFLHYARTGFESGMALMFLVWGILGLQAVLTLKLKKFTWPAVLGTSILLTASMYTYHSAKLVVPLIAASLVLFHRRTWLKKKLEVGVIMIASALCLLPLAIDQFMGKGSERFHQATIFGEAESVWWVVQTMVSNVLVHLDPRFMIGGLTTTLRHGDGRWGILLPIAFSFWLTGVVSYFFWRKNNGTLRLWWLGMGWTAIGLLPAIMGSEVPHSNRALLALPGVLLTSLLGLEFMGTRLQYWKVNRKVKGSHGEKNLVVKSVIGTLVAVHLFFFVTYLNHYYTEFAQNSVEAYQEGYLETFRYVMPYEKGTNGSTTNQVIFTTEYNQPYIYALFVRRTNPIYYQGGSLNTYLFTNFIHESDLDRPHTVVVASPENNLPISRATKVVYGSDGQPRFLIFVNDLLSP